MPSLGIVTAFPSVTDGWMAPSGLTGSADGWVDGWRHGFGQVRSGSVGARPSAFTFMGFALTQRPPFDIYLAVARGLANLVKGPPYSIRLILR
jgi:hypothetical protein